MALPNQTLFKFYEGLNEDRFSDLTGYNLNRPASQLKENIEAFYDEYNAFVIEIKKAHKDYADAKSEEDLLVLRSELLASYDSLLAIINDKVKTDVPIGALFTDTVTTLSSDIDSPSDSLGATTQSVRDIRDSLEANDASFQSFKINTISDLSQFSSDIANLNNNFNTDTLDEIDKIAINETFIAENTNDIAALENATYNLSLETGKIGGIQDRVADIEAYNSNANVDVVKADVEQNKIDISDNTSNIAGLTALTAVHTQELIDQKDTATSIYNLTQDNKQDLVDSNSRIQNLEINTGALGAIDHSVYALKTEVADVQSEVDTNTSAIVTHTDEIALRSTTSYVDAEIFKLDERISSGSVTQSDIADFVTVDVISSAGYVTQEQVNGFATDVDLALKADKTEIADLALKTDLDAKADLILLDAKVEQSDLATYSTILYVDDELALKSNIVDVNTSLSLKANQTDVDTSLALKANQADVDTSLALKANQADIPTSATATNSGTLKIAFDPLTGTLHITTDGSDIVI